MLASGDFEGTFPLTREAGYKKENKGKQIGTELIYDDTDPNMVNGKKVFWILPDGTRAGEIITDIKSRCMSCIFLNTNGDYCFGKNNQGSLGLGYTRPSYYICPDFEHK